MHHTRRRPSRSSPLEMTARTMPAVASGRKGNVILALIDEAEHFLFDDVGKIADRALE